MAEKKTLVIHHDGQITVSGYSPLTLGEMSLNKIVAEALGMADNDYKRIAAKVTVTITLKDDQPIAYWEEDD